MVRGVHDLHYNGRFFTWANKQAVDKRVLSKIDRGLGIDLWEDLFLMAFVSFLPEVNYDHSPMLIQFSKSTIGLKPFKFFNFWTLKDKLLRF